MATPNEVIKDKLYKIAEKWMNTEDPIAAKKLEETYNELEKQLLK